MSDTGKPIYEPGDIVFGADPFRGDESARPWLVLSNHDGRPFHGDQYIVVTLTTRTWMDGLITIDDSDWVRGGTPSKSRIVPWGVQSISSAEIDYWQGTIERSLVADAIEALVTELQAGT